MERLSGGELITTPIRIRDVVRLLTSLKSAQRRYLEHCVTTLTINAVSDGGLASPKFLAVELFTAIPIPLEPADGLIGRL